MALGAAGCSALRAQPMAPMDMPQTMETRDQIPPDDLPVPQKLTGVGNVHLEITGKPEAQFWFNQGLNLLHDFWDYEALRAFEQGVRVDPQCAMCYWGLYKAESFYHSNSPGYAAEALAKAVSLKDRISTQERLYIEASAAPSAKAPGIWRQIVKKYPTDTQARIFLANSIGGKEALELLQSVLKEEPMNSAANHYYVHNVEGSDHPEDALHSAEILAGLAPSSGHMVHMPGHIFFRMGDYTLAEQAFAASMQTDERYMQEQHVKPEDDWNYVHNLMYAIANLMEEGKMKEATSLSAKLNGARGELAGTLYIMSARDSISRLNSRLPVALRTANWVETLNLLREAGPFTAWPTLDFLSKQLASFATGMKAIESGDLSTARQSSARFDAELLQGKKDRPAMQMAGGSASVAGPPKNEVMPDALPGPILSSLSVMSLELQSSLLAAQGRMPEAKSMFAKAAQAERALGYHEPPNYIRPVGETEGAAMLAAGEWSGAKAAYERALMERPRSGLVLYGIALSSEKAGETEEAVKKYGDFLAAWQGADPGLPQVAHGKDYVAGRRTTSAGH